MEGGTHGPGIAVLYWPLDIDFWARLPRPCVGGVRGWNREAGSEPRWAAGTAVQGTVTLVGPSPQSLSLVYLFMDGMWAGFGSQTGKMMGRGVTEGVCSHKKKECC